MEWSKQMKVVFFEEVEGTALVGEVKEVKNGFARNYLLPRGLAGPTTQNNMFRAERLAQADAIRQEKLDGEASPVALAIAGQELTFQARVGEQGRLFGSITARDIAERLTEIAGASVPEAVIEHRQVLLAQSLRSLGTEDVRVRLTRNVSAEVRVTVVPDADSAELSFDEVVAEVEEAEAIEQETDETEEADEDSEE
ncbi:MAG: 50S ribosomal protein L9 [Chloroflexi bacterium]|nr:50S ribosomal protein L9 [Chloroflexota bacterium]